MAISVGELVASLLFETKEMDKGVKTAIEKLHKQTWQLRQLVSDDSNNNK